MQLKDIYSHEVSKFIYKYNKSQLPATFNDYFKLITDVHQYNTRQTKTRLFALPKGHSTSGSKMIKYSAVEIWSEIPLEIKYKPCLTHFIAQYKKCATRVQGYLELRDGKLQKRVNSRKVTKACHTCQVLWPLGVQQAYKTFENSQWVPTMHSRPQRGEAGGETKWSWGRIFPICDFGRTFLTGFCCLNRRGKSKELSYFLLHTDYGKQRYKRTVCEGTHFSFLPRVISCSVLSWLRF